MRARLNPILKYGGASNEKSKALFPSHTPILPSLLPSVSHVLSGSLPSPVDVKERGQEEKTGRKYEKKERKRRKEGKRGKREGYRDEGPRCWWCKTETDSVGWRSKSIEQSRRGGGQPGQGERRGEGEPAQGLGLRSQRWLLACSGE